MRISDWSSDVCSSDLLLHSSRDTCTLPPIQLRGPFCGPRPRQLRRNNKSIRAFRHNYDRALKEKRRWAPIPQRETPATSPLSDLQQTGSGGCCLLLCCNLPPGSSEELRGGTECVRTGSSRWWLCPYKKNKKN